MKALTTFVLALQSEYHVPVQVNISNDSDLTLTFPQSAIDAEKMDSTERRSFARRVALFAKAHYPKAGELAHISVTSSQTTTDGALTMTRRASPYKFDARTLSDSSSPMVAH